MDESKYVNNVDDMDMIRNKNNYHFKYMKVRMTKMKKTWTG